MELKKLQEGKIKKYNLGGVVGGAAQAALGIGQTIYGMATLRSANKEMESLLANAPKLTLPSAYNQYAERALSDTMLRSQTEAINRNLSSSAMALGQAGGRALVGGLQSQVSSAEQSQLQAQAMQNQQAMQGLGVLGQAQERLQDATEQRFKMQYQAADAAKQAALANIGAGLKTTAMGATVGFGSFAEGKEFGGLGSKASTTAAPSSSGTNLINFTPSYGQSSPYGAYAKNVQSLGFEKGGKLKGEFSHKSNPIDMVDKNGNKVGEATGGEYIINPSQAKAIAKQSAYFRNLLKQKQFKK